MDEVPAAWWFAAGRLSQYLDGNAMPFGPRFVELAATGLQIPARGVAVVTADSLDSSDLPDTFVAVPSPNGWTEDTARLVSAHVALGRRVGVVRTGLESAPVDRWLPATAPTSVVPHNAGDLDGPMLLHVGRAVEALGVPAVKVVVVADAVLQVDPASIEDGVVVAVVSGRVTEAHARNVAALCAHAARVFLAAPARRVKISEPWLASVDLLLLIDDGETRWRPAGSSLRAWRSAEKERAKRRAAAEAKAATLRAKEEEKERLEQEARERQAAEDAARAAENAAREVKRQKRSKAQLQGRALAAMKRRGLAVPEPGSPVPEEVWIAPCPWCWEAQLALPPATRSSPTVTCPSCGQESRRSLCRQCTDVAVLRIRDWTEVCERCLRVQPPPPETGRKGTGKGWRRLFGRS